VKYKAHFHPKISKQTNKKNQEGIDAIIGKFSCTLIGSFMTSEQQLFQGCFVLFFCHHYKLPQLLFLKKITT